MNVEQFNDVEQFNNIEAFPSLSANIPPMVNPPMELETVGNVNRLMTKRDWVFWSGSTAGGIGFTGAMLGVVTVNPILMVAGAVTLIAGSISMIGAALFHCFSSSKNANQIPETIIKSLPELSNLDPIKELQKSILSSPQIAPQPFFANDGTMSLLRPAPAIKNLVLQGGGVKGISYLSFLETLDAETGLIANLREVAGTSAGAIMAFLLASGKPLPELKAFLEELNMFEQLGGETKRDLQQGRGIFSANKLTETLCEMTSKSASDYIQEHPEVLEELAKDSANIAFIERAKDNFQNGITFRDLAILHSLNPEKFKLLHVTGYNKTTQKTEYYNLESCPDMYCNDAVRISMAIPLVIKSIMVNGHEKTDGAQGDNAPLKVFRQRKDYNPCETLMLVFERNGAAAKILHAPPTSTARSAIEALLTFTVDKVKIVADSAMKSISTAFSRLVSIPEKNTEEAIELIKTLAELTLDEESENNQADNFYGKLPSMVKRIFLGERYVQDKKREQENIHSLGPNVLIVPHGSLETTSFNASKEALNAAKQEAIKAAKVYLEIRKNTGFCNSYESLDSAIGSLSPFEKEAIRNLEISDSWSSEEQDFYAAVRNVG